MNSVKTNQTPFKCSYAFRSSFLPAAEPQQPSYSISLAVYLADHAAAQFVAEKEYWSLNRHCRHVTQMLRQLMASAASSGLTVMRTWAHAVSPQYALQTSPGMYSEPMFVGLDYVLNTARQNGLKVSTSRGSRC